MISFVFFEYMEVLLRLFVIVFRIGVFNWFLLFIVNGFIVIMFFNEFFILFECLVVVNGYFLLMGDFNFYVDDCIDSLVFRFLDLFDFII